MQSWISKEKNYSPYFFSFYHFLYAIMKLKMGKLIIIRTSVTEAINRAFIRFDLKYPNATEKEEHKMKKYTAYELQKI